MYMYIYISFRSRALRFFLDNMRTRSFSPDCNKKKKKIAKLKQKKRLKRDESIVCEIEPEPNRSFL